MKLSQNSIILTLILSIFLGGCATRQYSMDSSMGVAVHENVVTQIINPNGIPPSGPQGLYGAPAKAVMDRYVNTFLSPPPPANVFSIGIGGAGSSTMTGPSASTNP